MSAWAAAVSRARASRSRRSLASPRPSLVLLAYAAANIIALFPLTPGGLGIVEASLSGLLILTGVRPGYALLATLAYRVASYWLPLLAGPPAYLLFRHRYGTPTPEPVSHQAADTGREHHPPNKGVSALQGSQQLGWESRGWGPTIAAWASTG